MSFPGGTLPPRPPRNPVACWVPGTALGGTLTSQGFVQHLRHRGIECPVKLVTLRTARGMLLATDYANRPQPVRRGRFLVFALPGGESILSGRRE